MSEKKYIIVKDRFPRISEILNDCNISLCVPTYKNESLSSILQKICSKVSTIEEEIAGGVSGNFTINLSDITDFASATGSPASDGDTLGYTLDEQPANYVFAGPTTGSDAVPTFRPLVADDIPPLPYVESEQLENGLVSGGIITWLQNYEYAVSPAVYNINGVQYTSPYTEITLNNADPDFDRIDVVAVDINGNVVVITGTPSEDPQAPSVDPETQLLLSFILVTAGSTQPIVNQEWIYRENVEWTTSTTGTAYDVVSINNPFQGTFDVEATSPTSASSVSFTTGTPVAVSNYNVLNFRIRLKALLGANSISFRFYLSGSPIGISVSLVSGAFGLNGGNISSYQNISIPLANFSVTGTLDQLTITQATATLGWYMDDIQLQESFIPTGTGDFILNQYSFPQLANYRITGNGSVSKMAIGGTTGVFAEPNVVLDIKGNTVVSTSNPFFRWKNTDMTFNGDGANGRLTISTSGSGTGITVINSSSTNPILVGLIASAETSRIVFADKTTLNLTTNAFPSTQGITGFYQAHNIFSNVSQWNRFSSGQNAYMDFYPTITGTSTSLIKIGTVGSSSGDKEIEHITASSRFISPQGNHRVVIGSSTDDGTTPLQIDGLIKARSYGTGAVTGTATYNILVDSNGNIIEGAVPVGGGILGITADNGLTTTSSTNVQLGGTLLQSTTINGVTFPLTLTSSVAGGATLNVTGNVNTGVGVIINGNAGRAMTASSSGNADAVTFSSTHTSGSALNVTSVATSVTIPTVIFTRTGNSATPDILQLRNTTSPSAVGLGSAISFYGLTTGVTQRQGSLSVKWSDNVQATRTSQFTITGVSNAGESELFTISGSGSTRLNKYGIGTFTGTPTYTLQVDSSGNIIEGSLAGGLTANNGLTMSTPTNVQLGGSALVANTSILTSTFDLTINSSNATRTLKVVNTSGGGGHAIEATSTAGNGIAGNSTSSFGGAFGSTTGHGIFATSSSTTNTGAYIQLNSSTTAISNVAIIERLTTGAVADGLGGRIEFKIEDNNGSGSGLTRTSNQLVSKWTTAASATRTSQFIITGVNSATTADLLTISGNGASQLNKYGLGTFTGTAAYILGVDASGNIIETSTGGGGDTNFALNDLTATGNRTHDWATFDLTIDNIGVGRIISGDSAGDYKSVLLDSTAAYLETFELSTGKLSSIGAGVDFGEVSINDGTLVTSLKVEPQTLTFESPTSAVDVYFKGLNSAATAEVLFYDSTTGLITYGATPGGGGGGTVTSVAASITAGAISIAGSPITASGTLAFTYTGSTSQYIRGDGSLATLYTGTTSEYIRGDGTLQTFPTTISGITADNGLTASSSTNVQLGGSLLATTTITTGANRLEISGTGTSNVMRVSGTGVDAPVQFTTNPSDTGLVYSAATFVRNTSGGAAVNGIGVSLDFPIRDSSGGTINAGQQRYSWTDVTTGTRTAKYEIYLANLGSAPVEKLVLSGSGALKLTNYGSGTFTGTATRNLAVDSSGNIIETTTPIGGLTAITADNGLTANTISNIQLGGTLLQNTTIATTSLYKLTVSGSSTTIFEVTSSSATGANNAARISASAGADALRVDNTSTGRAIYTTSTSGEAILALATSGVGASISSTTGLAATFTVNPASTSTNVEIARFQRSSSSTATTNIGGYLSTYLETDTGNNLEASRINTIYTSAVNASRTSQIEFWTVNSGTSAKKAHITGAGQLNLVTYGSSTHTGTATFLLATDSSGNVIEYPISVGGGANQALSNLASVAINTSLVSDTDNTDDLGSPTIGWKDTYTRTVKFDGSTSGTVTVQAPAVASTPTITLPTVTGTLVQFKESTITSSNAPTPTGDARENYLDITAQAVTANFAAPSGTASNHNLLTIRIKDNGISSTITWHSLYRGGLDIPLPTATVAGKTAYIQFVYNSTDTKWDLIGLTERI